MLKTAFLEPPDGLDEEFFAIIVPADHYLRRVKRVLDFERFRDDLAAAYSERLGRPPLEPLLLFKLEYLQYHYNLSDRVVMDQAQVNMAYRFFLGLGRTSKLPHHTLMTYFRDRLGPEQHQRLFDQLIAQGREHGLVKDRLRLKDATHIIANIAVPSTVRLVADARERLLAALSPLAAEQVAVERRRTEEIRVSTADLADEERLLHRVVHLRALVLWAETLRESAAYATAESAVQQALQEALHLAHKILADRETPASAPKKDALVSIHDPDARRGMHGEYYAGYLLDVSEDADSALITNVHVLPANGDEAADAQSLIAEEEAAQGNDVQGLSMDAIGFRGDVLRELTDPEGLNLEVTVPPQPGPTPTGFPAEDFVLDAAREHLTCPAGQTTGMRKRSRRDTGWQFHYAKATCAACPLKAQCIPELPGTRGRTVTKNDYDAEYRAARAKIETEAYQVVRREHSRVERKLGEMVRWHRCRRARYRGLPRVQIQALLTAMAVNIKRMVRLLTVSVEATAGMVRAEPMAAGV